MTFKDLQKAVQSQQSGPELNTIPRDIPFWIWDLQQHKQDDIRTKGQCCFWHIIKCPQKDGRDMPVLPYQKTLYEALRNYKRIAILKARGIGITTFLVRYIAWCCLNKYAVNSRGFFYNILEFLRWYILIIFERRSDIDQERTNNGITLCAAK